MVRRAVIGRRGGGLLAATGLALALVAAASPRDGAHRPAAALPPEAVVARLGRSGDLPAPLRAALAALRAAPQSEAAAAAAAAQLIAAGRARGEARLVAAALAVLRPFVGRDPPRPVELLFLAATARQHLHDFPGALRLLDAVLAAAPGHLDARLTRATVQVVRGDLAAARADCAALAPLRADVAFLCTVTAGTLTAEAPALARRLAALLAVPGLLDPALRPWALSLAGEIARLQGDAPAAEAALRAVLAADPAAQREALMLADLLLEQGRAAEVAPLLAALPATDGVLLRRLRAARAQGRDDPAAVDRLAARVRQSRELGLAAHAREEGQFLLWIADDAAAALERATVNWALQHEFDDALLLLQAARAAGRPAAAAPVHAWIARERLTAPALRAAAAATRNPAAPAAVGEATEPRGDNP
jgi:hypothetical protein